MKIQTTASQFTKGDTHDSYLISCVFEHANNIKVTKECGMASTKWFSRNSNKNHSYITAYLTNTLYMIKCYLDDMVS